MNSHQRRISRRAKSFSDESLKRTIEAMLGANPIRPIILRTKESFCLVEPEYKFIITVERPDFSQKFSEEELKNVGAFPATRTVVRDVEK